MLGGCLRLENRLGPIIELLLFSDELGVHVLDVAADFFVVTIRVEFSLVGSIEEVKEFLVGMAREMRNPLLVWVEHEHEDFEVAKDGQFDCLFDKTLFALAKAHFANAVVENLCNSLYSFFAHGCLMCKCFQFLFSK